MQQLYTHPIAMPLNARTEIQLVHGDYRPEGMRSLDRPTYPHPQLWACICTRFGERNEKIMQRAFGLQMLALGALDGEFEREDVYVSQGVFSKPNRRKASLYSMAALFADIDIRSASQVPGGRGGWTAKGILDQLLKVLDERSLPRPSYALASGRGLHLKWLTEPIPSQTMPRWKACMRTLCDLLTPWGADQNARDCSRVLRPIGSWNTKAQAQVKEIWRNSDERGGIAVYKFEDIAAAVLPASRDECKANAAARKSRKEEAKARRRQQRKAPKVRDGTAVTRASGKSGSRELWQQRLRDIEALLELRRQLLGEVTLRDGLRVTFMLVVAVALSHLCPPDRILERLQEYRDRWLPHWSDEKLRQSVATVLRCATEGQRLKYTNDRLLTLLQIEPSERAVLKAICRSPEERAAAKRASTTAARRAAGVRPAYQLQERRRDTGARIVCMREDGESWKSICKELNVPRSTANRLAADYIAHRAPWAPFTKAAAPK
jgi:hypothetical protein